MLAFPHGESLWGNAADLALTVPWERFIAETDELIKPYLHWVSQQTPFCNIVPESVIFQLAQARQSTRIRNLRWASEIRAVVKVFSEAKVPFFIAKGAVLQRTVYPDPSTRPITDIDLYVKGQDIERVYDLLPHIQFLPFASRDSRTPIVGEAIHEEGLFLKQTSNGKLILDVHTQLDMNLDTKLPPWGSEHIAAGSDGIHLPTLDTNTALRHICFHLARHGFENGLMWLLDIKLFAQAHAVDWDDLINACEPDSRPLLACTVAIADDWLGGCVPHGVRLAVAPAVLNAAAPLIWSQMWDLKRVTAVLPVTTAILSGNPQEIWRYFRNRYVSWTAPIPNSQSSNYVLILKRLRTAAIWFMIAVKQGGFSIPSLRTARLSNHRFTQLKELLWK